MMSSSKNENDEPKATTKAIAADTPCEGVPRTNEEIVVVRAAGDGECLLGEPRALEQLLLLDGVEAKVLSCGAAPVKKSKSKQKHKDKGKNTSDCDEEKQRDGKQKDAWLVQLRERGRLCSCNEDDFSCVADGDESLTFADCKLLLCSEERPMRFLFAGQQCEMFAARKSTFRVDPRGRLVSLAAANRSLAAQAVREACNKFALERNAVLEQLSEHSCERGGDASDNDVIVWWEAQFRGVAELDACRSKPLWIRLENAVDDPFSCRCLRVQLRQPLWVVLEFDDKKFDFDHVDNLVETAQHLIKLSAGDDASLVFLEAEHITNSIELVFEAATIEVAQKLNAIGSLTFRGSKVKIFGPTLPAEQNNPL